MFERDSNTIERMVLEGSIDLAILSKFTEQENLCYEEIATEEFVLIAPPDSEIGNTAIRKSGHHYPFIELKSLAHEPFIKLESGQRSKEIMEGLFRSENITPNTTLTLRNIPTVIRMVNAGCGYSMVLESHVKNMPRSKRPKCFSLGKEGLYMNCVALYRKNAYHPKYERDFIELVRKRYQTMMMG